MLKKELLIIASQNGQALPVKGVKEQVKEGKEGVPPPAASSSSSSRPVLPAC